MTNSILDILLHNEVKFILQHVQQSILTVTCMSLFHSLMMSGIYYKFPYDINWQFSSLCQLLSTLHYVPDILQNQLPTTFKSLVHSKPNPFVTKSGDLPYSKHIYREITSLLSALNLQKKNQGEFSAATHNATGIKVLNLKNHFLKLQYWGLRPILGNFFNCKIHIILGKIISWQIYILYTLSKVLIWNINIFN